MEHGETSTVFVVARSAKRNNHDPHDLLVGFRRVDDIFFATTECRRTQLE